MSNNTDIIQEAKEQFEYPMLDPLSVPIATGSDTLHIRGGPISGPNLTIRDEEEEGHVEKLADLLDGETHVDEIIGAFSREDRREVAAVLLELYEADAIRDNGQYEDWNIYDHEPIKRRFSGMEDERTPLEEQSLAIVNIGPIGQHVVSTTLDMGVGSVNLYQPNDDGAQDIAVSSDRFEEHDASVEEAVEENDFLVYLADRPCPELEDRINVHTHETKTPWLVGQMLGYDAFVGPAIFPELTACFECYKKRLETNVSSTEGLEAYRQREHAHAEDFDDQYYRPIGHMIAGMVTHDLGNLMEFEMGYLADHVVSMGLYNLNMTANRVVKLPRCDVCGVDPSGRYNPLLKREDVLGLFDIEEM